MRYFLAPANLLSKGMSRFQTGALARILLIVLAWAAPAWAAAASIELDLPLDCAVGKTCWIVNYVDLDPTAEVKDFACGTASYNGHKGVDFAIRDMAAVRAGVAVRAAAPGTVIGVRDGMKDIDFNLAGGAGSVRGRECGNGVMLSHADGWRTQYCHMREGSIVVKEGERVAAGDVLGMVGHSGLAMFPHLHLQVMKAGKIVDPFVGLERTAACGPGATPLWNARVLAQLLPYAATFIYNAGFAAAKPDLREVREGGHQASELPRGISSLFVWADIFWVRAGDKLSIAITGPDGAVVARTARTEDRDLARAFRPAGVSHPGRAWPPGVYRAEFTIERARAGGPPETVTAIREVTLR